MITITTLRDLWAWFDNALPDCNAADREILTDHIQRDDHPRWGSDWGPYLSTILETYPDILLARRPNKGEADES